MNRIELKEEIFTLATLSLVTLIWLMLFGFIIHMIYKCWFLRSRYKGVTIVEALFIFIGVFPGLAGCGSGSVGLVFPLPIIFGGIFNLLTLKNKKCGWTPTLWKDGEYFPTNFEQLYNAEYLVVFLVFVFYILMLWHIVRLGIANQRKS